MLAGKCRAGFGMGDFGRLAEKTAHALVALPSCSWHTATFSSGPGVGSNRLLSLSLAHASG